MDPTTIVWMALLMGLVAALYSAVGHGGASAYLAIMALFSVAPETMRPTALALNLIVSGFAAWRYFRGGQFNSGLFLAFAVTAVPMAFLGGRVQLPPEIYRPLVGAVLWFAAIRFLWQPARLAERTVRPPRLAIALPTGAGLGFLAGLTGTGGGIFLSPLILLFRWEEPRRTSGVAAAFIFVNSAALPWFAASVAAGALAGTWLGMEKLPRPQLLQALGLVLTIAGAKLIFS